MDNYEKLTKEIDKIKVRNSKVETDKAWETSFFRKVVIAVLTYGVIVLFFYFADLKKPFINAIVPTIGFILSTLSVSFFKNFWIKKCYQKRNRTL